LLTLATVFLLAGPAPAETKLHTYTLQLQATAANAGGQKAYALRRGNDFGELGVFYNEYLTAKDMSLFGATYGWRFPICGQSCFWQAFAQVGGGISNGGPLFEVIWSTIPFWVVRLDFATQIFVGKTRLITWSYPLWLGVSLPLPF